MRNNWGMLCSDALGDSHANIGAATVRAGCVLLLRCVDQSNKKRRAEGIEWLLNLFQQERIWNKPDASFRQSSAVLNYLRFIIQEM